MGLFDSVVVLIWLGFTPLDFWMRKTWHVNPNLLFVSLFRCVRLGEECKPVFLNFFFWFSRKTSSVSMFSNATSRETLFSFWAISHWNTSHFCVRLVGGGEVSPRPIKWFHFTVNQQSNKSEQSRVFFLSLLQKKALIGQWRSDRKKVLVSP